MRRRTVSRGLQAVPHVVARPARWELNLDTCRGFVSIYWYSRKNRSSLNWPYFYESEAYRCTKKPPGAGLFALLKPYRQLVAMLVVLTIAGNGLNLVVPKLISHAIDAYTQRAFVLSTVVLQFFVVAFLVFALTYLQSLVQTYASERVAKDLRTRLAAKLATQTYSFVEQITPAKLLTNLTSDVDGVKLFVSMAIATIISSIFLIVGSSVLLLSINWRLGLSVLGIVPFIGVIFYLALKKVRELFKKGQEAIDWLNRVINESILGATLIRLLNSQQVEYQKFVSANAEAKNVGLSILSIMSALIPTITLAANAATVIILLLGGRFVIAGRMTLGDFSAFNTYLALLIFPIILLGFMSNVMAQAGASYMRLSAVLMAPDRRRSRGASVRPCGATSRMSGISLKFGDKEVLKRRVLFRESRQHDRHYRPHRGGQDPNAVRPDRTA